MYKRIRFIKLLTLVLVIAGFILFKYQTGVSAHEGHKKGHAPASAKRLRNPVPHNIQNIENGRALFQQYCASCHGEDGKAQTEAAKAMKVKPTDLTSHYAMKLTDGEIFWVITNGIKSSGMPAYKSKMSDRERWQVTHFVKHLTMSGDHSGMDSHEGSAQKVTLRFKAMVGDKPFDCSESYDGIGTTGSKITATDFRFYVHNIRLVDAAGHETPLQLAQDGKWQYEDVALIDFENGAGPCANGTQEVRDSVEGSAPGGKYNGVRFTLGVPFDKNHKDPTAQPSPLNLSRMFWNWNAGYKFARIDLKTTGQPQGYFIHLGSTGCKPSDTPNTVPTICANQNLAEATLTGFNPNREVIIADLKALLDGVNVDQNQPKTPEGCMSAPLDGDCAGVFKNLGLAFPNVTTPHQKFFRIERDKTQAGGQGEGIDLDKYDFDYGYRWALPAGFPRPRVPGDNPMSEEKFQLGRHLFYDKRLSSVGTFSCASCHRQELAFTDGKARGLGVTNEVHPRGSMSLTNVAYEPMLTWANPNQRRLEAQALVPMFGEHPVELGLAGKEQEMIERLKKEPRYHDLFAAAFPNDAEPFTLKNITYALASFERGLISGNAPYDRYRYRGERNAIPASAKRGEQLFFSERLECFHCHGGFNFTETVDHVGKQFIEVEFHNTGLYNIGGRGAYPADNPGLSEFTSNKEDTGKFKAPTLRNIELTAPYMHDGSVGTLDEAIDHYAAGGRTIRSGPNVGVGRDNPFKSGFVKGFKLTKQEKGDLINFLKSLTDREFVSNSRFSDPWNHETAGQPSASSR